MGPESASAPPGNLVALGAGGDQLDRTADVFLNKVHIVPRRLGEGGSGAVYER